MYSEPLALFSNVVAVIGILLCFFAGMARLVGSYELFGYEAMTLFIGGIALMVFAVLIKLHIIKTHILKKD